MGLNRRDGPGADVLAHVRELACVRVDESRPVRATRKGEVAAHNRAVVFGRLSVGKSCNESTRAKLQ